MRLKRKFFNRPTIVVAKDLLGKYLVRRINPSTDLTGSRQAGSGQAAKVICARITETEAYCGVKDKACHASRGRTKRTETMFGPPGRAYVYMIYGMYHCFNVVTREAGCPEAVLVRGAEIKKFRNLEIKKLKGPGILCRELKIDRRLNNIDLCNSRELWIESASRRRGEKPPRIKQGKRIGVDYAGKWKDRLWRFYL